MSHVRGVIFELDGVLVHTDEFHFRAWKEVAGHLGIPFTHADGDRLRGVSRAESLDTILRLGVVEMSAVEKGMLADEKNRRYRQLLAELTPGDVDPDVRLTLTELRERGLRLAIGSSSRNAKTILDRVGLRPYFDAISDGENITRSKPDPEVFRHAARFLALTARECAVVEDARAGVDAAVDGGFACFGIDDAAGYARTTWPISSLSDVLGRLPAPTRGGAVPAADA